MREKSEPRIAKWPFFLGDIVLYGTAYLIYAQGQRPLTKWELLLAALCIAGGAVVGVVPYVLEYRVVAKLAEAGALTSVVAQVGQMQEVAARISGATSCWQNAQDAADKTAAAARSIAERMSAEVQAFTEFMQRANDTEKSNLRLEVEKLKRAESDWLQVLVRMLDHVYALHVGAVRSGQPNLIDQLTHFQNACRDAARRVGLTPFAAEPAEPFDAQRHQLLEGKAPPGPGALVTETIATGYTFQGRLLRPALVRCGSAAPVVNPESREAATIAEVSAAPIAGGETGRAGRDQLPREAPDGAVDK